jgi:hypothetical protein
MNELDDIKNLDGIKNLEKEIDSLDGINEWSLKIKKMKELKEKIALGKNKITEFIETINSPELKKLKKFKNMSLDDLLKEFETTQDIENKVQLFIQIHTINSEYESELFDK